MNLNLERAEYSASNLAVYLSWEKQEEERHGAQADKRKLERLKDLQESAELLRELVAALKKD